MKDLSWVEGGLNGAAGVIRGLKARARSVGYASIGAYWRSRRREHREPRWSTDSTVGERSPEMKAASAEEKEGAVGLMCLSMEDREPHLWLRCHVGDKQKGQTAAFCSATGSASWSV